MTAPIQRRALATLSSPRAHFTGWLKGVEIDNQIRYDVFDLHNGFYHGTLYLDIDFVKGKVGMFSVQDDFESVSVEISEYNVLLSDSFKLLDLTMDSKGGCMYMATDNFYED